MTDETFVKGMALMSKMLKDTKEHDADYLELYRKILGDMDDEHFMATVNKAVAVGNGWFPTPPEFRTLAGMNEQDRRLQGAATWADVVLAIESGVKPSLDGPTQKAVDALGGLSVIGGTPYSEHGFLQRRFMDIYQAGAESEERALLEGWKDQGPGEVKTLVDGVAKRIGEGMK